MSKICDICGRGPVVGASKSHSHISTKRWLGVNLQNRKINGQKKKVCTSCLKNLTKQAAALSD
jgi:large subunit ribosomal protein L28